MSRSPAAALHERPQAVLRPHWAGQTHFLQIHEPHAAYLGESSTQTGAMVQRTGCLPGMHPTPCQSPVSQYPGFPSGARSKP